eukprot:gene4834-6581_t
MPFALAGCVTGPQQPYEVASSRGYGVSAEYLAMYGERPDEEFPLPATDISEVDPRFLRREVSYPTREQPGTIIVDTPQRFLFLVLPNGRALRYGIGVGRPGFSWAGMKTVSRKAEWPNWTPLAEGARPYRVIRRHLFLVIAAAVLGLMIVAAVLRVAFAGDEGGPGGPGGGRGGPGGGRGQAVSEAVVTLRPFSDQINVLGVARGRRSVNVTSSTSELITAVLFSDGQRVAAGTPLVQLQAREEDASIIQARAQVAQAQREYDRFRQLAERGVAPRVSAEDAET